MLIKWLFRGMVFVLLSAFHLSAADDGGGSWWTRYISGRLAVSYDEGLACRYLIVDKVHAYGGISYYVKGPDTLSYQPLNSFSFKLGYEYQIAKWDRLKLWAFGEGREELIQRNSAGTVSIDDGNSAHMRYNVWNTIFRFGIRPELFITDHLSFDYKFGMQMICHGADFKVNGAQNGLESRNNDYTEFGVYEGRHASLFNDDKKSVEYIVPAVLLNIGFNIYF